LVVPADAETPAAAKQSDSSSIWVSALRPVVRLTLRSIISHSLLRLLAVYDTHSAWCKCRAPDCRCGRCIGPGLQATRARESSSQRFWRTWPLGYGPPPPTSEGFRWEAEAPSCTHALHHHAAPRTSRCSREPRGVAGGVLHHLLHRDTGPIVSTHLLSAHSFDF
jgi:hypothetical protein